MSDQNNDVVIKNVSKTYELKNEKLQVLKDINLDVKKGEFITVVGASGCGKSTLLKLISGLEGISEGSIELGGVPVKEPDGVCGMVFQEARLCPWLNVYSNIAFGLKKKVSRAEKKELVGRYIELVGLSGFEKALPEQLSGGMQQRASIARELVGDPDILLLDEPFGALDAITRINMQQEVLRIWQSQKKTMILVTHDIDEAIYLGDRVVVLSSRPGTIRNVIKVDLPRPRGRSSAAFIEIRSRIYKEFFDDAHYEENVEYYI
ncbi:MAG: ABC transporter ATP-binding protein [Lachnospiraceae bacterium]|nr:ABC transporter ATP-binding protein [Lachnospiraceae bacterium]